MFQFQSTGLKGALLITYPKFEDERGSFSKIFNDTVFKENNIDFEMKECYFSYSEKGVVRGMHFQNPPYDHGKIVMCPQGAILDVIVDLRKGSATFGQYCSATLSRENHQALYIPKGFAHGFKALTRDALTYYLVSSVYNKDNDSGIRYDSFGFDWDEPAPVVSARDLSFPALGEWTTVF
jgi:dTDP-4-dehydrorhamnose 3,5-epimerase